MLWVRKIAFVLATATALRLGFGRDLYSAPTLFPLLSVLTVVIERPAPNTEFTKGRVLPNAVRQFGIYGEKPPELVIADCYLLNLAAKEKGVQVSTREHGRTYGRFIGTHREAYRRSGCTLSSNH